MILSLVLLILAIHTTTTDETIFAGSLERISGVESTSFGDDLTNRRPDQAIDIRAYGARAVLSNAAPAIPGIKATIDSRSRTATLSDPSSFQNGDGVVLLGAGPNCGLSTPSAPNVTPSLAAGGTGTGIDVNAPAGATSYAYEIVAADMNGCITAASPSGSTSTGSASLGVQSQTITSANLGTPGNGGQQPSCTVYTVPSTAGLAVGEMVEVVGTSNRGAFDGWWTISYIFNRTSFCVYSNLNANILGNITATGGTLYTWNANRVTWPAVSNTWVYYIYGRTAGSLTLLGVTRPFENSWDDFGATMMGNFSVPYTFPSAYVSTPPSSSFPDYLVTTITAGAGTTTLTLSNQATNAATSQPILYTIGPALQAAVNALGSGAYGPIYIPQTGFNTCFVLNDIRSISNSISWTISQAGQLCLNQTLSLAGGSVRWYGDRTPVNMNWPQFNLQQNPFVNVGPAYPGLYQLFSNSAYQSGVIQGVTFQSNVGNNAELVFNDGANFAYYKDDAFNTSTSGDYMGVGLTLRSYGGGYNNASFEQSFDRDSFISGMQRDGVSATPALYLDYVGDIEIDHTTFGGRTIVARSVYAVSMKWSYAQGNAMPLLYYVTSNGVGPIAMHQTNLDTSSDPLVAVTGNGPSAGITIEDVNTIGTGANIVTGGGYGPLHYRNVMNSGTFPHPYGVSDSRTASMLDNTGHTPTQGRLDTEIYSTGIGHNQSLFTLDINTPAAPGCATITAGPPYSPAGSFHFNTSFVYPNGGVGFQGPYSSYCSANGTSQQIVVTLPALPPGAIGYWPNYDGGDIGGSTPPYAAAAGGSFVFSGPANGTTVQQPAGGPAGIQNGIVWAAKLLVSVEATQGQCFSSSSPAACGADIDGFVIVAANADFVVVDTSAVTSKSEISLTFDVSQGPNLGVKCNATPQQPYISSRTAGKSFTISVPAKFVRDPGCIGFHLRN